jgi:hypothetical protein
MRSSTRFEPLRQQSGQRSRDKKHIDGIEARLLVATEQPSRRVLLIERIGEQLARRFDSPAA